MTSQIVTSTLDEDFPVAGQDNDSQGFRDNFSVIKTGLETAASEISVLQETTAKLGSEESNNFLGGYITNVKLRNAYRLSKSVSEPVVEELILQPIGDQSDYFKIQRSADVKININWPVDNEDLYIKIRLEVVNVDELNSIKIAFLSNPGTEGELKTNFINLLSPITGITLPAGGIGIFDCWIAGANSTMFVQHIETFE